MGKTVETVAANFLSSPAMMNFGDMGDSNGSSIMASQAKTYVVYAEGIYTDYKYYETRYKDKILGQGDASSSTGAYASSGTWDYDDEVVYPFCYGLSYTIFTQEFVGDPVFNDVDHTLTVTVKVTTLALLLERTWCRSMPSPHIRTMTGRTKWRKPLSSLWALARRASSNPTAARMWRSHCTSSG